MLSAEYLKSRGKCCGLGCANCPYVPKHTEGSTKIQMNYLKLFYKMQAIICYPFKTTDDNNVVIQIARHFDNNISSFKFSHNTKTPYTYSWYSQTVFDTLLVINSKLSKYKF